MRHKRRIKRTGGRRHSCIIIGAGLAGLAAAYRLTNAGWRVTVLEAQKRLGGRVLSHSFTRAPHLVCELGGEWIGNDHGRVKRLCRQFNLQREKHQYSFGFWDGAARSPFFRPGAWSFARGAEKRFNRFGRWFNELNDRNTSDPQLVELDQADWWSTLKGRLRFSERDLMQRDLMDSTDFGETIRLSSAYLAATEYFAGNKTDEMDSKIRGGNSLLIESLARAVKHGGGVVLANMTATHVHQDADGVEISVKGRSDPFKGDFCLCTTPAHCVPRLRWSPKLPLDQFNAASQLQYSRIMKTAVLYGDRFWPARVKGNGFSVFTSRVADFCFDSTLRQRGPGGILCSYAIGDKADDLASERDRDVIRWITEDAALAAGLDSAAGVKPLEIRRQPWQRQEWIGGAYAFYRPGQWFVVRPLLQRRHLRVFFAGEHLSEAWQGFMEGAVETGEAAADELIAFSPR